VRKPGPLALVAVVVVIAAGVVILSGGKLVWPWQGDDAPEPDPCAVPRTVASDPVPAAPGVRVVDQGFTETDKGAFSMGVLVKNTSDKVAYRTRITYILFEGDHVPVGSQYLRDAVIPILMPGQEVGLGVSTGFNTLDDYPKVTSFEARVGTTTWLPALTGFSPTTATYLRTQHAPPGAPPYITIDYHAKSAICRTLNPARVGLVFRDAGGRIIGGDLPDSLVGLIAVHDDQTNTDVYKQPASTLGCSPGENDSWIIPTTGRVPGMVDALTEIYPFCDVQAPA
jgi:hypothetical protein